MERGATAACVFDFGGNVDLARVAAMKLFVEGESGVRVEKSLERGEITFLEAGRVLVAFTQEDTLRFNREGEDLRLQFQWRDEEGAARTSKIINSNVYEFLGSEPI